jgi:predicted nuclease of predicted toxin-antitoxin system
MTETVRTVLLDQNVPLPVAAWLREVRPHWTIHHAQDAGLAGSSDEAVFRWAQTHEAMIVTYDEDFADARTYALGRHWGIIRLKVWPTTVEKTREALSRLLTDVPEADWQGGLVIIDNEKIRIRRHRAMGR